MQTLLAFIVAILILVSLHEFGHYIIARLCGVKVLRFSVGFGKPFYTKKQGDTEWCFAPIPLGGYVKMVDTREGNVAEADLPFAFDKQHPLKRIAIVAAGPITNLLLAAFLYGLSFSFGVTELRPYIGTEEPASIAAKAGFQEGDLIQKVNGVSVKNWADAQTEMVLNLESDPVLVNVQTASGQATQRIIDAAGTSEASKIAKNNGQIGLVPFKMTNQIGFLQKDGPAQQAGLKEGDILISVDGITPPNWQEWASYFRQNPGKKIELTYLRHGQKLITAVRLNSEQLSDGTLVGRIGVAPSSDKEWDKKIRYEYQPSIGTAFAMGWHRMTDYSLTTVKFFGKLISGHASLNHVSGPLTIANVAGQSAEMGLQSYLEFLALVSISLGVMNLLPVPVLDGGHLVYYTVELIRGKPLSERIQTIGLRIGLGIMLLLMFVAFFNDINRLFG